MPLMKSKSKKAFNKNVAELIHAGHSVEQSVAIAYKVKGEKSKPKSPKKSKKKSDKY